MKEFARAFYSSYTWRKARANKLKQVGGLCERCLTKGIYSPAEIIHHRTHLTPENITDPKITTDLANLEALCRECHADEHLSPHRYRVDEMGNVIIKREI